MKPVIAEKVHRITMGLELLLLAAPTSLLLLLMLFLAAMELHQLKGSDLVMYVSFLCAAALLIPFWRFAAAYVVRGPEVLQRVPDKFFRMLKVAILWVLLSWILVILFRVADLSWNLYLLGICVTGCFGTLVAIPAAHLLFIRRALSKTHAHP